MHVREAQLKLHYQLDASLPTLSWCARVRRDDGEIHVRHGRGVETRPDFFVEGAWDGPFAAGDLDRAVALAGSGGRIRGDGVVFAASSSMIDRLQLIRRGDTLWISNSMPFLLVAAEDRPDPRYSSYFRDFLAHYRAGTSTDDKPIRTQRGAASLYDFRNVVVSPGLDVEARLRPLPPRPRGFRDYVDDLAARIYAVVENATDACRAGLRPVATLSRGYDSPAIAVMARAAGCKEAVTLRDAEGHDSGLELGERLGYRVVERDRERFRDDGGLPEADFQPWPTGSNVALAALREELSGSLCFTGHNGDFVWSTDSAIVTEQLRKPFASAMYGAWMTEFRLRAGFVNFAPAFLGAHWVADIHRITQSEEMRAWRIGGSYDRPIPRRILEEADVPRERCGQRKSATAHEPLRKGERLTPAARADLERFFAEQVHARECVEMEGLGPEHFTFQWTFEHLRDRYEEAPPGRGEPFSESDDGRDPRSGAALHA